MVHMAWCTWHGAHAESALGPIPIEALTSKGAEEQTETFEAWRKVLGFDSEKSTWIHVRRKQMACGLHATKPEERNRMSRHRWPGSLRLPSLPEEVPAASATKV